MRFSVPILISLSLLTSCGSLKKVSVASTPIVIDGNVSDWDAIPVLSQPNSPIVAKVSRDAEFLYVYVRFADRRSYSDALQFGFTIYAEHPRAPKRSFGISIPTGLLNELAAFPGARKAYLSDPQWIMQTSNRNLLQQIERDMPSRALVSFRKTKGETLARWPLPLVQLAAMDVLALSDTLQTLATELKIPLKTSRQRQFGIDVDAKDAIRLGLEIRPPAIEEIQDEQDGLNPQMNGMDRVGRNAAGPNQRAMMQGMDQQLQMQQLMMLRMGSFEKWFLLKPPGK